MKNAIYLFCAVLLIVLPIQLFAWGMLGHRITGQIAESYLTAKAKQRIHEILGDESIAMASNYPDFIKSDTNYKHYDGWHYLNVTDGLSYKQMQDLLQQDKDVDVYTKINYLVSELKNKKLPHDKQVFDLKFLIHLVGDLHEPMHVSRDKDEGGNKIKVTWFGANTNLHSVWDYSLIEYQKLSYTEYAAAINHSTQLQRATWQQAPLSQWVYDSYIISQQLYKELEKDSASTKLSYRYNFDHYATLNNQLLKGGVRLAGLLNQIFNY